MYEWATLCNGSGTDHLGTWCISEDKKEIMKLLGCDEKYYSGGASDFEMLAKWEEVLPLCAGTGNVTLYKKQLSLLNLNKRSGEEILDLWRDGNRKLEGKISSYFEKEHQEILEKQGVDIFELMMKISKSDGSTTQGFVATIEAVEKVLLAASECGVVLRLDALQLSYARPDRYHAELFWHRILCGEKLNSEEICVLKFQALIEVLLFFKTKKISVTLHLRSGDAFLRERIIAYLKNYRLIEGELRFSVTMDEPASFFLPLCHRSDAELRILPELLLRPSDFGASFSSKLSDLISCIPVGGLRYGGLETSSFSMALAARELCSEVLDQILSEYLTCDEKRKKILDIVFNY